MYITRIEIENIRSIKHLIWEIDAGNAAGWHVILGDNGAGKSTFVRSVALCTLDIQNANALRQDWIRWIRGEQRGAIAIRVHPDVVFDQGAKLVIDQEFSLIAQIFHPPPPPTPFGSLTMGSTVLPNKSASPNSEDVLERVGSQRMQLESGWFSASYGPFRRFTGGSPDYEKLFQTHPRLAAHLSAFSESVALSESLRWLQQLHAQRLEDESQGDRSTSDVLLKYVKAFINDSELLPFGVRLERVTVSRILFMDGNGNEVPIEELSDGYRSILSLTLDLIRQLTNAYKIEQIFDPAKLDTIVSPGVVLVDEIDVHLHPTWQRKVGQWFTTHFPQMQFIVTTHSPLVCQAAERGSIFKLPTPGTDEQGEMITGTERDRLLYGNILDAYSTEVFGSGITRSDKSQEMLERLGKLNIKELRQGLTQTEKKEQVRLRAMLPTGIPSLNGQ